MAEPNPKGCGPFISPVPEDARTEFVVLAFLFDEHPVLLTIPELSRALNAGSDDFASTDAVERAVRELVGAGLLHCQGPLVVPTRAALYFERLSAGR